MTGRRAGKIQVPDSEPPTVTGTPVRDSHRRGESWHCQAGPGIMMIHPTRRVQVPSPGRVTSLSALTTGDRLASLGGPSRSAPLPPDTWPSSATSSPGPRSSLPHEVPWTQTELPICVMKRLGHGCGGPGQAISEAVPLEHKNNKTQTPPLASHPKSVDLLQK
jgi:hypothetical protein